MDESGIYQNCFNSTWIQLLRVNSYHNYYELILGTPKVQLIRSMRSEIINMIKVASQVEILQFFKAAYGHHKQQYFGYYNSFFNKIITQQQYMLLPVDQRTATRAHGVFDVVYLKNFRLINLDQHIHRLHNSAKTASIAPPYDHQQTKQIIIEVVEKIVDHHLRNDPQGTKRKIIKDSLCVRITISSGFGDFSVASLDKQPILYIVVFEPYISERQMSNGVSEYVTKIVEKPKEKVHSKTIDYIDNAIMANLSKAKGGYQGIKALPNGVLLEAASANIGFIFGKQFAAPRFQTVIEGTTIKRSLTFIESLVKQGTLQKISFRDITIQQAQHADQMIIFGGDKVVPVLKFNDHVISESRGSITKRLQEWYASTINEGTPIKIAEELLI